MSIGKNLLAISSCVKICKNLQTLFMRNYTHLCTILITEIKYVYCEVRNEAEETVNDLNITFEPNHS